MSACRSEIDKRVDGKGCNPNGGNCSFFVVTAVATMWPHGELHVARPWSRLTSTDKGSGFQVLGGTAHLVLRNRRRKLTLEITDAG